MRFIKTILLVISSVGFSHLAYPSAVPSEADTLSPSDLLSKKILILADAAPAEHISNYAGIYHDQPLQEKILDTQAVHIVQLDERLNPAPYAYSDLPGLFTLASLSDSSVVDAYAKHLIFISKALGIDKCMLPASDAYEGATLTLLNLLSAHHPQFFMNTREITHPQSFKKTQLTSDLTNSRFLVVSRAKMPELQKRLAKYGEKIIQEMDGSQIRNQYVALRLAHRSPDTTRHAMSNQLALAISQRSIIPLQRTDKVLPITADSICFLSDSPYGELSSYLAKYAHVITDYNDIISSKAPLIIDDQAFVPQGLVDTSRTIIFVGQLKNLPENHAFVDGALLYTSYNHTYDYVIPQQLFGAKDITGRLPYPLPEFQDFQSKPVTGLHMLGYAPLDMAGFDKAVLDSISLIMQEAISTGCTPGGQLVVALDGALVLDEAYGYLTYDSLIPTERSTLYDLASVTKVSGTLLAVMKLYEEGLLDLDKPIPTYLPEYAGSNKENITMRSLLSHNAGLKSYLPFWQQLIKEKLLTAGKHSVLEHHWDEISLGQSPEPNIIDTLNAWIIQSPLITYSGKTPPYLYSDLGFMILHQIVERVTGEPIDDYLQKTYYGPLHLTRLAYNPLDHGFSRSEIAPTEKDTYFRDELVWGEVHDRNAAVFGGVAGHAGLFSNARDLTVILQTILQGGSYGGHQFLKPETVAYFNHQFYPNNRRALGWDKKDSSTAIVSDYVSPESFGHTGFTGTMVWVDPSYQLVFVFLSNRVYPNANNYKLVRQNIRTRLQDVVYKALAAKWINTEQN